VTEPAPCVTGAVHSGDQRTDARWAHVTSFDPDKVYRIAEVSPEELAAMAAGEGDTDDPLGEHTDADSGLHHDHVHGPHADHDHGYGHHHHDHTVITVEPE
jgi:hypothetical protein